MPAGKQSAPQTGRRAGPTSNYRQLQQRSRARSKLFAQQPGEDVGEGEEAVLRPNAQISDQPVQISDRQVTTPRSSGPPPPADFWGVYQSSAGQRSGQRSQQQAISDQPLQITSDREDDGQFWPAGQPLPAAQPRSNSASATAKAGPPTQWWEMPAYDAARMMLEGGVDRGAVEGVDLSPVRGEWLCI